MAAETVCILSYMRSLQPSSCIMQYTVNIAGLNESNDDCDMLEGDWNADGSRELD
jgi:hypothetical protein